MPTKERYFNFYHWYILMSQFASQEVENWAKENKITEADNLTQDCLAVIDTFVESPSKTGSGGSVDYMMNIFVK